MASLGFSKSGRDNGIKGLTYQIDQEEGLFSFSADAGENTDVWFKKYSTPSAFEAEEAAFGSSWSFMGPASEQSSSISKVNTELDGSGTDYFNWLKRASKDLDSNGNPQTTKTEVLDEFENKVVADADWYKIYYHDCAHLKGGGHEEGKSCGKWTVERTGGNPPSDV